RMRSALQRLGEFGQRRKQDGMPLCQRAIRKREAQMCLPRSRRAKKDDIGAGAHEGEIAQFSHATLRERWLKGEIKAFQRLFAGNACGLQAASISFLLTAIQFGTQRALDHRFIGPLLPAGRLQQLRQCRLQMAQIQLLVRRLLLHAHTSETASTPQYWSYSASARLCT